MILRVLHSLTNLRAIGWPFKFGPFKFGWVSSVRYRAVAVFTAKAF
jgi:hypothetical protein